MLVEVTFDHLAHQRHELRQIHLAIVILVRLPISLIQVKSRNDIGGVLDLRQQCRRILTLDPQGAKASDEFILIEPPRAISIQILKNR